MSDLLSDEELRRAINKFLATHSVESPGKPSEYEMAIAQAQRQKTNEDWVRWINDQRVAGFTLIEGIGKGIPVSQKALDIRLKEVK